MASELSVLVVEDEPSVADFLTTNLREDGFAVQLADSLGDAAARLDRRGVDVVLLDVTMPDGSGFDLLRRIRDGEIGRADVGVVVVTARSDQLDILRGFDRGADDYVGKPFHYPELRARIAAVGARTDGGRTRVDELHVGPIAIDIGRRSCVVAGEPLPLPAKEFDLLVALAREPDRMQEKQELLRRIWGYRQPGSTRTLDSHASRLRRRLEAASGDGPFVINHWSRGYSLVSAA